MNKCKSPRCYNRCISDYCTHCMSDITDPIILAKAEKDKSEYVNRITNGLIKKAYDARTIDNTMSLKHTGKKNRDLNVEFFRKNNVGKKRLKFIGQDQYGIESI